MVGFGDGGGGATDAAIARVAARAWIAPGDWFATLEPAGAAGVQRRTVPRNAPRHVHDAPRHQSAQRCARARARAVEEACAWCVAVRAPQAAIVPLDRRSAHGVDDRLAQSVPRRAGRLVDRGGVRRGACRIRSCRTDRRTVARRATQAVLPRTQLTRAEPQLARAGGGRRTMSFISPASTFARACAPTGRSSGSARPTGPACVTLGNGLAAYVDTPAAWDAWNLDRGYVDKRVRGQTARGDDRRKTRSGRAAADRSPLERSDADRTARGRAVSARRAGGRLARRSRSAARRKPARRRRERRCDSASRTARSCAPPRPRTRGRTRALRGARVSAMRMPTTAVAASPSWRPTPMAGMRARSKAAACGLGMSLLRSPRWPDPAADRGEAPHRVCVRADRRRVRRRHSKRLGAFTPTNRACGCSPDETPGVSSSLRPSPPTTVAA